MRRNNKNLRGRYLDFIFLFALARLVVLSSNSGCKNPYEYEPQFDSLYPPPPAPQLISPPNDTEFWYDTFPQEIILKWSFVEGAEHYQLQISGDSATLPDAKITNVDSCSMSYTVNKNSYYFWHVRAYNHKWTWFTDWSETRHFGAFYAPTGGKNGGIEP